MNIETITQDFRRKVGAQVRLEPQGLQRFRVFTPFRFDDGDHLSVVLKQEGGRWLLSDEGHTFMHLTYDLDEADLHSGTRQVVVANALSAFGIEDRDGELALTVPEDQYGDALFSFVQGVLKITDVLFLSRERVRSTFLDDFHEVLERRVPAAARQFAWHDPANDPEGKYVADCRLEGLRRPVFIYALPSDEKVTAATIALLQFERWRLPHHSIGIFEDQASIGRKVLAWFSDVCDKQFSSLAGNQDRVERYVEEAMEA